MHRTESIPPPHRESAPHDEHVEVVPISFSLRIYSAIAV
jgi:hypothetical protein